MAENGAQILNYRFQERVKYPQRGVYDLHFQSALLSLDPPPKMLEVSISIRSATHAGQHSSYWFGA